MRAAVEFLHDGQAAQHKLHAALPQQQASCNIKTLWRNKCLDNSEKHLNLKASYKQVVSNAVHCMLVVIESCGTTHHNGD